MEIPRLRSGGQKLGQAVVCTYKIVMETPRLTASGDNKKVGSGEQPYPVFLSVARNPPTRSYRLVARPPPHHPVFLSVARNLLPVVGKD